MRARHRPYLRYAASQIIRQGPPQAACLGLVGWFAMWQTRPQAAHPRAPAARGADKGRDPQSGQGPNARRLNCGRARAAPQRARTPPRGLAAGRRERGGAATPGGPSAGRAAPARAEPQAGQRGAAGRSQARPGRRRGRPHSPHRVGAGPRRSTDAATGEGEERGKAARSAPPKGAWPCGAGRCPRATAGGWQAPQGRDLSRRRRRPAAT